MKLGKTMIDALSEGWRNLDAYTSSTGEGQKAHAEATVKALKKAGYRIVRITAMPYKKKED